MVAPGPNFSASVRVKKDGWYSVYRERRLAKGRTPQLLPQTFRPYYSIVMRCHSSQKPGRLVRRRVPKSGVHALSHASPRQTSHTHVDRDTDGLVNARANDLCLCGTEGWMEPDIFSASIYRYRYRYPARAFSRHCLRPPPPPPPRCLHPPST